MALPTLMNKGWKMIAALFTLVPSDASLSILPCSGAITSNHLVGSIEQALFVPLNARAGFPVLSARVAVKDVKRRKAWEVAMTYQNCALQRQLGISLAELL